MILGRGISIHALLAESDFTFLLPLVLISPFLSTLSLRRATWLRCWQLAARDISIHALLAESDNILRNLFYRRFNFYPRSPCGERRNTKNNYTDYCDFYPRSPCGERLYILHHLQRQLFISIHALLAESDRLNRRIVKGA